MRGYIRPEDFDRAIVRKMGAVPMTPEGQEVPLMVVRPTHPAMRVTGPPATDGAIPVFFYGGSSKFSPPYYPCILITRTSNEDDTSRVVGWNLESVEPALDAVVTTVTLPDGTERTGHSRYHVRTRARPRTYQYELKVISRSEQAMSEVTRLVFFLTNLFHLDGFALDVYDSENELRVYSGMVEDVPRDISFLDMTHREITEVLTLSIAGEWDFVLGEDVPGVSSLPTLSLGQT